MMLGTDDYCASVFMSIYFYLLTLHLCYS